MRQLAARALNLIAVSEYTKSRIVKILNRDPDDITVVHNGCHMKGRAGKDEIAAARTVLALPTKRYVLGLSSMESRKNITGVLRAWEAIQQVVPQDIWLVLAGRRADEAVFGKQQNELCLPRVAFTGYVPEEHLAGLYSGASLFVFPSLAEGFGLPLLEAMACGVRCITSNSSSLPEVGGDVVDYVDPLNDGELAGAMLRRLLECTEAPIPYVPVMIRAKRFTWDSAAEKTWMVLKAATSSMPLVCE
jgi:glycosyltransferase involved in cell wall biosynthesis